MADVLQVVELSRGGRPVTVLDLEQVDTSTGIYAKARDSFVITPPTKRPRQVTFPQRFGGQRTVGEGHDNGQVAATWLVRGSSADVGMQNAEALLDLVDDALLTSQRYLLWRPDGATKDSLFELRGPGVWAPKYGWAQFSQRFSQSVELTWPVAPYVLGLPMDIWDEFDVDSRADYTFLAGGTDVVWDTANKRLTFSAVGTKIFWHTRRGYTYADEQQTIQFTTGASVAGSSSEVCLLAALDANNYVMGRIVANGASSLLQLYKADGGAQAQLGASTTVTLATNTTYWLRFRTEGNNCMVELFTSEPTPTTAPAYTRTFTLTGADAVKFGSQVEMTPGIRLIAVPTDWTVTNYKVEPFTYSNVSTPEVVRLGGKVPGNLPALANVDFTFAAGQPAPPVFALFGWSQRPRPFSFITGGDFEDQGGTPNNPWLASGGNVNAGATLTIDSIAHSGTNSLKIATTALGASFQGAAYNIRRRFKKGRSYTAEVWVRKDVAAAQPQLVVGDYASTNTTVSVNGAAGAGVWEKLTVTYVANNGDADHVQVIVRDSASNGAAAHNIWVDEARFYETTAGVAVPTLDTEIGGRGGRAPFGLLNAEDAQVADGGWAVEADAAALGGWRVNDTTPSVTKNGFYSLYWDLDPGLLDRRDLTDGDLVIECWARVLLTSSLVSPRLVLSATPKTNGLPAVNWRYTEFGSTGKLLTVPSSGTHWRLVKLGTLALSVEAARVARWQLQLAATLGPGSAGGAFGVDYLVVNRPEARQVSPTGRANDGNYPKFVKVNTETRRVITADGRGFAAQDGSQGLIPAAGLAGRCELPPGDVDVLTKLSSLVPDDPTVDISDEQLSQQGTLHLSVRPRYRLARA